MAMQNFASLWLNKSQPLAYRLRPMAHAVFDGRVQLGIGDVITIGDKDGVVTKTILTDGLVGDGTVQAAVEKMGGAFVIDEAEAGSEMGGAVGLVFHVLKDELKVGQVIAMAAGIAGRPNAGSSTQGIDKESGVFSQDGFTCFVVEVPGF